MPKTVSRVVAGGMVLVGSIVLSAGDVSLLAARRQAGRSATASLQTVRSHAQSSSFAAQPASPYRAVLDRYCVTCHNARVRSANLQLDAIDLEQVGQGAQVWEKVLRKLRTRAMPPSGRPRPDETVYDGFASWLEAELDRAAAAHPNPGRPAIHRLNRTEYANAIRDLLALDVDSRALLPADDLAYGFDNNADLLTVSPGLLERYLSAARKISALAVGDPHIHPVAETHKLSSLLEQGDRTSDDLPFGTRGGMVISQHFPLDGEYVLRIRLQRDAVGNIRGIYEPQQVDVRLDGARLALWTTQENDGVSADWAKELASADAGFDVRFAAKAGMRKVAVALLKRTWAVDGVGPSRLPVGYFYTSNFTGYAHQMGVGSIQIEGPYNAGGPGDTSSRHKIFVCRPTDGRDATPCATQILSALARRAYHRPVTNEDLHTLLGFYQSARDEGGDFDAGIQLALEKILIHPEFLFRVERDPVDAAPTTPYRLNDYELASRLSFFLWSTIPDEELLRLAAAGDLSRADVLERQVRRMLSDARSAALGTNFAAQWLHLRNMRAVAPDVGTFPEFDDNLREAFQRETELFVESQLRLDRSVSELLTANYTFVNERLARHYGIPDVYGSRFRRVTLADEARRGLLGHGSILTVTSYATRTSPVVRGKWLLENVLDAPPPPPPDNVPALKENNQSEQPRSVRERMEQHRSNPVCAACHVQMDPLGFALENFDAIGKWRSTTEAGTPVDASGVLPDGTKLDGPVGLRNVLQARRGEFVATVTSKLLTYALGRGVESYDMPAIRRIVREAAPGDFSWSSIIVGIAKSTPFQMRRSEQ